MQKKFQSRYEFSLQDELVYCRAKLDVAKRCKGHIAYWEARVKEIEQKFS